MSYIKENSSICEILKLDSRYITKDRLYGIIHRLYREGEGLELHLSRKTNELFDLQDKIILYDLTNTYFEGAMRDSALARRGRSKEKRSDCPLMVLALVVNVEGFTAYFVFMPFGYTVQVSNILLFMKVIKRIVRPLSI